MNCGWTHRTGRGCMDQRMVGGGGHAGSPALSHGLPAQQLLSADLARHHVVRAGAAAATTVGASGFPATWVDSRAKVPAGRRPGVCERALAARGSLWLRPAWHSPGAGMCEGVDSGKFKSVDR